MAAAAEGGGAKMMFSMNKVPKRQAVDASAPNAADASTAQTGHKLPKLSDMGIKGINKFKAYKSSDPLTVLRKLNSCDHVIAIDIETHRLIHDNENLHSWAELDFGLPGKNSMSCIDDLRIVQIGWTVGGKDQDAPRVVQRLIQPEGYHICPEATKKHGISHDDAMNNGDPLKEVLKDLIDAVHTCCVTYNGRLASHQLSFDAGIVSRELYRCSCSDAYKDWASFSRRGICTMDPDLACHIRKWKNLKDSHGKDIPWLVPIGLKDMVRLMTPEHSYLIQNHHGAAADSEMCWRVWRALALQRAALWEVAQSP